MIPNDKAAEILRLAQAEKWPPGTIASQLGVHHSVVTRVLGQQSFCTGLVQQRPSIIDPYLPFVLETLAKYPRLPASRLYQMVLERGYKGAPDHFRSLIARHRPKPVAEAFLRLRTLPGEHYEPTDTMRSEQRDFLKSTGRSSVFRRCRVVALHIAAHGSGGKRLGGAQRVRTLTRGGLAQRLKRDVRSQWDQGGRKI